MELEKVTIWPPSGAGSASDTCTVGAGSRPAVALSLEKDTDAIGSAGACGVTVMDEDRTTVPVRAVRVTAVGTGTKTAALREAANVPLIWPAGINTGAGAPRTAAFVLLKLTSTPPAAAGAPNVTTPATAAPGMGFDGFRLSDEIDIDGGGVIWDGSSGSAEQINGCNALFGALCPEQNGLRSIALAARVYRCRR